MEMTSVRLFSVQLLLAVYILSSGDLGSVGQSENASPSAAFTQTQAEAESHQQSRGRKLDTTFMARKLIKYLAHNDNDNPVDASRLFTRMRLRQV